MAEDPVQDGRALRSARSRERLIEALLSLVQEGNPQPTGQEVADRAGMNLRTVLRHFEDMEALHGAIREHLEATLRPQLAAPPAEGALPHRLRELVRRRARAFELIAPFQRSERLQRDAYPGLQRAHEDLVRDLRGDLRRCLPEVAELPAPLRAAAELVASFEAWDRLRSEQGLGVRPATAAVEAALARLLGVST